MRRFIYSIIFCLVILTGCGTTTKQENGLSDGVLTVGMEADYAPYNWTTTEEKASNYAVQIAGSNSYVDGYDVHVASYLAKELGVKLEIKKIAWDGLIPALQSGDIDAIIAGMAPTASRREQINFSDSYYTSEPDQVIVVDKNSAYTKATNFSDLKGAKITAQQGTLQVDLLKQLPINQDEIKPYAEYASIIQACKSGVVDGYLADRDAANAQVKANSNLEILDMKEKFKQNPDDTTTAIGLNKKDNLILTNINDALAKLKVSDRELWMQEAMKNSKDLEGDE